MARSHGVRIGAIENAGPNTLVAFLRNAGVGCNQIDIAAAFITVPGLDSLSFVLKRVASRGKVRVLTGLYQGFTDPKALRTLLREQDRTGGRLEVRLSKDSHFHWKAYTLVKKSTAKVIIGSSNLTDDGLQATGELNAVLSLNTSSSEFAELRRIFEEHWKSRAKVVTDEMIAEYERYRKKEGPPAKPKTPPLKKILGGDKTKKNPPEIREPRYWRTCIHGHLSDETNDLLKQTTGWDKRGWWYFCTWKQTYNVGDKVILLDWGSKSFEVIKIVDTTKTPVRTPDGRYFAAYRRIKKYSRRKLTPARWKALKQAGLVQRKDDIYWTKRLPKKRFDLFLEQLKKS